MTNHTQEELQQTAKEDVSKLDELVALAQGWTKVLTLGMEFWDTGKYILIEVLEYHPTQPTTEGKAQAFDLMVKLNIAPVKYAGLWTVYKLDMNRTRFYKNPQVAIVIASILSLQEGE
jgi:hypothetical protein